MQKNLEIREGRREQWNPTATAWNFFFFLENFPVNIHSDSFPFFIMLYSYFLNNECRKKFEIKEETLKHWKPTSTQRIWQIH